MDWDLGIRGLGTLLLMAAAFAVIAQVAMWPVSRWIWLIAGGTYFALGLFVSEVWFGWATEEDLQPNVDGLSYDEVLLIATGLSILVMGAVWFATRHHWPGFERLSGSPHL